MCLFKNLEPEKLVAFDKVLYPSRSSYFITTNTPVKITRLASGWGHAGVVRLGIGWQRAGGELVTRTRGWLGPGWQLAGGWLNRDISQP